MSKSCSIIPKVKTPDGKIVESQLFKDLLEVTNNNREKTKALYTNIVKQDFLNKHLSGEEFLDENGEPNFLNFAKWGMIGTHISMEDFKRLVFKKVGMWDNKRDRPKIFANTDANFDKVMDYVKDIRKLFSDSDGNLIIDFTPRKVRVDNGSGPYKLGISIYETDNNSLYNLDNSSNNSLENTVKEDEYIESLNSKLTSILEEVGVGIGELTDLERKLGADGVVDFNSTKQTAEGLIELIRLAKGEQGQQALPEEFAHFALRALGNNQLVTRLLSVIKENNLAQEILGEQYNRYAELYDNSESLLAEEAAGKLVAKHFLQQESIPNKPYKTLLGRVINSIRGLFSRLSGNRVRDAINEAEQVSGILSRNILDGSLTKEFDLNLIKENKGRLFSLNNRVKRDRKILDKILDTEIKKFTLAQKRDPKNVSSVNTEVYIAKLRHALLENKEIEAIYSYLDNTSNYIGSLYTRLEEIFNTEGVPVRDKAAILREVKEAISSISGITEAVREALNEESKYEDNRYGNRAKELINEIDVILKDLNVIYEHQSTPLFVALIKPFIAESDLTRLTKIAREYDINIKKLTVEDLVKRSFADISFKGRWLDSLADSTDPVLRALDQVVKKRVSMARQRTIDLSKKIQAIQIKAEQNGMKSTEFMFEKFEDDGSKTGNYIPKYNTQMHKVAHDRRRMEILKMGIPENSPEYNRLMDKWHSENSTYIDNVLLPNDKYLSEEYKSLNDTQKEFYDSMMSIKAELDALLPEDTTTLTNAIKIRKDLVERLKGAGNLSEGWKEFKAAIADNWVGRSDDVGFQTRNVLSNFDNTRFQTLPIYYINTRGDEHMDDLSTDVASTLIAYSAMAYEFSEMNKIIDTLEIGRDLLRRREVVETQGDITYTERIKGFGRNVLRFVVKEEGQSNMMDRVDDFFQMQIYKEYKQDEGDTLGVSRAKAADNLSSYTSKLRLGFNTLNAIANVLQGESMLRIEAIAGEFFGVRDVHRATIQYFANINSSIGELGKRVKTNKIDLFNEYFNVHQDFESSVRHRNFDRKTWASKAFTSNTLFFMNHAGEHFMQTRSAIALALRYKMKDNKGNEVSLWDALEVQYVDPSNKSLGATLTIKEGYTKADGSLFTKEDVTKFTNMAARINQRMHGIYNKEDMSAMQKYALGRLAIQFRKWMVPAWNRRFSRTRYDEALGQDIEGYYTTVFGLGLDLYHDLKQGQFDLIAHWDSMTPHQRANIVRAATEVGQYLAVVIALALFSGKWGDDDEDSWVKDMLEYQLRRLKVELGAMIPSHTMFTEGVKILQSPAAGVKTLQTVSDAAMAILWVPDWWEIREHGLYKGLPKNVGRTLRLIPLSDTIYRTIDPSESINFYR